MIKRLIYITVSVFLATQLWRLVCLLFCLVGYSWQDVLALRASWHDLAMQPWTLLTYMFCHADLGQNFLHIVFNMLWLWWFGPFFLRYHTGRQLLGLYLSGGLFAGLFFVVVYNSFPYFLIARHYVSVVGASGALCALIAAIAIRQPHERLGLNLVVRTVWVKLQWFALAALALNILSLGSGNTGGIVCHLGGALFGVLYGMAERRGHDLTAWVGWLGDHVVNLFRQAPRLKASRGGRHDAIPRHKMRDMEYNAERRDRQQRIDAILDKISRNGYDGLTAEEKQLLFDASKKR